MPDPEGNPVWVGYFADVPDDRFYAVLKSGDTWRLTGEWQVHGRSSIKNFEDVIKLDLRYQERWSLMYDFKLIFQTVWVMLSRRSGAY